MNPWWGHAAGVITVVLMLAFVGIWVWVWLPFHARTFDALARIPMRDAGDGDANEDEDRR